MHKAGPDKVPIRSRFGTLLPDLMTVRSKGFFKILEAQVGWMEKAPEDWEGESSFQSAKKDASALVLVNDRAERAVKLIKDYNALLRSRRSFTW